MTSKIVNANNVIGVEVRNYQDENLGEVEAIMLDKATGQVVYVVLSYGGFTAYGE